MVLFMLFQIINPFHSDGLTIYTLANSADPDEMQHYATFNLGLSLFAKVPVYRYPEKKRIFCELKTKTMISCHRIGI